MFQKKILNEYRLGQLLLNNRVIMAPMTRCRAIGNIPNDLMALYYEQRSKAGLIITESTAVSPNGLGFARIPGIFSKEQIIGWRKVTNAVHAEVGKIVLQLMHSGGVGHTANLPAGSQLMSPSGIKPDVKIWTDDGGLQENSRSKMMESDDIRNTINEYKVAAQNAMTAGFDLIELHCSNGYLLEQFLSPVTNHRTDSYGGSIENRCRFVLDIIANIADAIGKDRVGIRFSPYGKSNGMRVYPEIDKTYVYLAQQLNKAGILYIHLVDQGGVDDPVIPESLKNSIRAEFKNTLILSGGYNLEKAEEDIQSCKADLISFGRLFINNPDLVQRFETSSPLSDQLDESKFYTSGAKGYTDYERYLW